MNFGPMLGRVIPVLLFVITVWVPGFGQAQDRAADGPLVMVVAIEGPIGPATVHHVETAFATARERGAEMIVLRLNTPGGLVTSTREIVGAILTAPVPVTGYVAPPGGHAASAGTYILYATNIAAMAPGTNLGAATPVQIGGVPGMPGPGGDGPKDGEADEGDDRSDEGADRPARPLSGTDAMTAKVTNDAVAFIRSLAQMRGRNADWAERAVREAASLPATEALEQGVIDVMADDIDTLLAAVDGREVTVSGAERTLTTAGATVELIEPGAATRLLAILSNPNLAFVLMLVGIYGIIFEFMNPGSIAPGVIGAISLTVALYALNQLPLDYAGLALVLFGIAFMVAESMTPAFGILGFGGLVAFVLGSVMLIDTDAPGYQISWWLIAVMAAISGVLLILVVGATWRAYRRAPVAGESLLAGAEARVLDWSDGQGHVWVQSERWRATGPAGLHPGAPVRITGVDGLVVSVRAAETGDGDPG